jgi:hypothetical protein
MRQVTRHLEDLKFQLGICIAGSQVATAAGYDGLGTGGRDLHSGGRRSRTHRGGAGTGISAVAATLSPLARRRLARVQLCARGGRGSAASSKRWAVARLHPRERQPVSRPPASPRLAAPFLSSRGGRAPASPLAAAGLAAARGECGIGASLQREVPSSPVDLGASA